MTQTEDYMLDDSATKLSLLKLQTVPELTPIERTDMGGGGKDGGAPMDTEAGSTDNGMENKEAAVSAERANPYADLLAAQQARYDTMKAESDARRQRLERLRPVAMGVSAMGNAFANLVQGRGVAKGMTKARTIPLDDSYMKAWREADLHNASRLSKEYSNLERLRNASMAFDANTQMAEDANRRKMVQDAVKTENDVRGKMYVNAENEKNKSNEEQAKIRQKYESHKAAYSERYPDVTDEEYMNWAVNNVVPEEIAAKSAYNISKAKSQGNPRASRGGGGGGTSKSSGKYDIGLPNGDVLRANTATERQTKIAVIVAEAKRVIDRKYAEDNRNFSKEGKANQYGQPTRQKVASAVESPYDLVNWLLNTSDMNGKSLYDYPEIQDAIDRLSGNGGESAQSGQPARQEAPKRNGTPKGKDKYAGYNIG